MERERVAGWTTRWRASLVWAAAYTVAALLGRATIPEDGHFALVWPATGVAVLWLLGSRHRLVDLALVGLATSLVNAVQDPDPRRVLAFALLNVVQAALAASVVARWAPEAHGAPVAARTVGRLLGAAVLPALAGAAVLALVMGAGPGAPGPGVPLVAFAGRNYVALVVVVLAWWLLTRATREEWRTALGELRSLPVGAAFSGCLLVYVLAAHVIEAPLAFVIMVIAFWVGSTVTVLAAVLFALCCNALAVGWALFGLDALPTAAEDPLVSAVVAQVFLLANVLVTVLTALVHAERDRLLRRLDAASRASGQQAQLLLSVLGSLHERITVLDAGGRTVVATPGDDAVDPEWLGEVRTDVHHRVLAGEHVGPTDVIAHDEVGRRHVVQVEATPLRDLADGELFGAVVIKSDVTTVRDEEARLASFAGSVAHDIRNPLSACTSWAELALGVLEQDVVDLVIARKAVDRSITSGRRAHEVVDGLLRHASARGGVLRLEQVDLGRLVASVVEDRDLGACTTVEELPAVVGDPVLLRQVFENLVGNAAKYVPAGRAPRIRISGAEGHGWVQVRVDDEGVGVPPGARDLLFEQFTRAHADRYSGTGLGLAICRSVVERHGGTIRVEDNPAGTGTRFVVTLPASAPRPHADTVAAAVDAASAMADQA